MNAAGGPAAPTHRDARLRVLLENLSGGLLMEDERRRIALVNREWCALFRLSLDPDSLIGGDGAEAVGRASRLFADPGGFVAGVDGLLSAQRPAYGEPFLA